MTRFWVRAAVLVIVPVALTAQTPDSVRHDSVAAPLTSGAHLTRAHLDSLPIDDPASAFAQIPGVFLRGGDVGLLANPSLWIRGGGTLGGPATYIDGAPVRSQLNGSPMLIPALNGIGGIDVTTGLAGVEWSDAPSGMIAYQTPAGGSRLETHWSAHTDQPFGSVASVGYNRFAGNFGGPLGRAGLTFFASGMVQGQSSEYLGFGAQDVPTFELGGLDTTVTVSPGGGGTASVAIPRFVQVSGSCDAGTNGADCRGLTRPFDWRTSLQFQGKLSWAYGSGSSLSLTGLAEGNQARLFPGTALGDPALFAGAHEWLRMAILNWHHRVGPTLALTAVMSLSTDYGIEGALTPGSEATTGDPSLGIELSSLQFSQTAGFGLPLDQQIIKNIRTNSGLRVPYLGQTQFSNAQPYRLNPYAMQGGGFYTQGINAPVALASERRRTGRWQLEWAPTGGHQVTVGVDADGSDLTRYLNGSAINEVGLDAWTASPTRLGLFGKDVIALGPATLEVGLRYDRVNPGVELPRTPGFTFSDPNWNASLTSTSPDAAYAAAVAKVFIPTRDQSFVTPRVRFGWQLDAETSVRASFGQALVTPPASLVAAGSNMDLTFTNASTPFGRDVNDGVASLLEGGVHRRFGSTTEADASVYYDFHIPSFGDGFTNYPDPTNPGRQLSLGTLSRFNNAYAWGGEVGLSHAFGHVLLATASYGLTVGGFEDLRPITIVLPGGPTVVLNQPASTTNQELAASAQLAVPDDWSAGGWKKALRNVGAVAQLRMITGLPYTPLNNVGNGDLAPGIPGPGAFQAGDINSERLPWTKVLDLRITKGVRASGLDWTVFADFRNLLNFKNLYGLYAETNGTTNTIFEQNVTAAEYVSLANEAANNGALGAGNTIMLTNCGAWQGSAGPVDCVMLQRAEARFGNGDGAYTLAEQQNALNAYFNMVYGSSRFYGPQRTVRVGLELAF